jgi:leucyl aminopeptidase (aminopeptidase T)
MSSHLAFELERAAQVVVRDLVKLQKDESLLITADTKTDWRVVEATARVAFAEGGKVAVMLHNTPKLGFRLADPEMPKPLKAAIVNCDAWIEYNVIEILYSTAWHEAMNSGNVRYLCLTACNVDTLIRLIGSYDMKTLWSLQLKVTDLVRKARDVKIESPSGTDIEFRNSPDRPVDSQMGIADKPGPYFPPGLISWVPLEDSVNGVYAFESLLSSGVEGQSFRIEEPIKTQISNGKVSAFYGKNAPAVEDWLRSLGDPNMYNVAHVAIGLNPGARFLGSIAEGDRVWGVASCGIGDQPEFFKGRGNKAIAHADGVTANASIWLDDRLLIERGVFKEPELEELAKKLRTGNPILTPVQNCFHSGN